MDAVRCIHEDSLTRTYNACPTCPTFSGLSTLNKKRFKDSVKTGAGCQGYCLLVIAHHQTQDKQLWSRGLHFINQLSGAAVSEIRRLTHLTTDTRIIFVLHNSVL